MADTDQKEELLSLIKATRGYAEEMVGQGSSFDLPAAAAPKNTAPPSTITTGSLDQVRSELGDCQRCKLYSTRNNIVFGVGNPQADLVIVGEAPGRDEDLKGEPFIGRAGKLLTDIIEAIGLSREEVYICNIIKCRPPENRNPEPDEIEQCSPFLRAQLATIKPKMICALGKFAAQTLSQSETPISKMRGEYFDYQGIPVMATYHPAYLLRNPSAKKDVWEDMKKLHAELSRLTGKTFVRKGK